MFFHALTFAGSQGSCLNTRPLGQMLKLRLRDLAAVIVNMHIFSDFNLNGNENIALSLKYPFSYTGFL